MVRAEAGPFPTAGTGGALAYDAARQRVVFFGGATAGGLHLDETWEWDGTDWLQRHPAVLPSLRHDHAMAYDAARQRVVLFGGSFVNTQLSDTWEWDGAQWTMVATPQAPPARAGHVLAYDPEAARIALFGGGSTARWSDLWLYDGNTWSAVATPGPTPDATPEGMDYDVARRRMVLLTSSARSSVGAVDDATWEWDRVVWKRASRSQAPRSHADMVTLRDQDGLMVCGSSSSNAWQWRGEAWTKLPGLGSERYFLALAFDARRDRVVAYGGATLTFGGKGNRVYTPLLDTLEFDGTAWQSVALVGAPGERFHHRLVYDEARGLVLLFGDDTVGSTFAWDGSTWRELDTPVRPPARVDHALTYDPRRERVVLFGGRGAAGLLADTWEWDGTSWSRRADGPMAPRSEHALVFDRATGRSVLLGGASEQGADDTMWAWDGTAWSKLARSWPLPFGQPAAYDGARRRLSALGPQASVWVFAAPARVESAGTGCAGTDGTPVLAAVDRPIPGRRTFAFDVLRARPRAGVTVLVTSRPAQHVLPGGCILGVDLAAPIATLAATTNDHGFATLPLPMPSAMPFGFTFHAQAAVVDPAASGGLALTQGFRLIAGE